MEVPQKKEPEFHAKPAPNFSQKPPLKKHLYQKVLTKPQTPTFMRRIQKKQEKPVAQVEPLRAKPANPTNTRPLPFSFELRNQYLIKRKEQFVKNFIEEEKRAREFHARPLPKNILSSPKIKKSSTKTVELRSKVTEHKLQNVSFSFSYHFIDIEFEQ